jgi:uncharacterized protein YerC
MSNAINPKRKSKDTFSEIHLRSLLYLCDALASLSDPVESALVLRDLFSPQEMITIANRLHIAALLIDGCEYEEIRNNLGVGQGTIARISTWLETSGDGYHLLTERVSFRDISSLEPRETNHRYSKYGQHVWPATLIKDLQTLVNTDNAFKIISILVDAKQKPALFKGLDRPE